MHNFWSIPLLYIEGPRSESCTLSYAMKIFSTNLISTTTLYSKNCVLLGDFIASFLLTRILVVCVKTKGQEWIKHWENVPISRRGLAPWVDHIGTYITSCPVWENSTPQTSRVGVKRKDHAYEFISWMMPTSYTHAPMQPYANARANPPYACMPHAHAHKRFMIYAPCPRGALYEK